MGIALGGIAAFLRSRPTAAGVLLGLAYVTQPLALLVAVPLLVVCVPRRRVALVAGIVGAVAAFAVPLAVLTSGRALDTVVLGTGVNSASTSLLVETGLHGTGLFAVSRIVPVVLAAVLAAVALDRLGARVREPVALLSLVSVSLSLRLVFEVSSWGYYLMAVAVTLVLIDVVRARPRLALLAWLALVLLASSGGVLVDAPTFLPLPVWCWQIAIDLWALALGAAPLLGAARATGRGAAEPSPPAAASASPPTELSR